MAETSAAMDEAAGLLKNADEKVQEAAGGEEGSAMEETAKQLAVLAQQLQLQLGEPDSNPSSALTALSGVLFEVDALSKSLAAIGVLPVQMGNDRSGLEDEEGLSADTWEKTPWKKPELKDALEAAAKAKFKDGKAELLSTGCDELGEMGVGVELYFRMLLMFSLVFGVMTAIAVPIMTLSKEGHGVSPDKVDPDGWVLWTLGNMGLHVDNIPKLGGCLPEGKVDCTGTVINATFASTAFEAAYMISFCDFMMAWFFVLFIVVLEWKIGDVVQRNDEKNVTAADYGVLVRNLPPATTEEEVVRFFSERYDLKAGPHVEWVMPRGLWARCRGRGARRVTTDELRERYGKEWDEQQRKDTVMAAKVAARDKAAAKASARAAKAKEKKAAKEAAKAAAKADKEDANSQDAAEGAPSEEAAPAAAATGEAAPAAVVAAAAAATASAAPTAGDDGAASYDAARGAYIEEKLAYTPHPGWVPVVDTGHLMPLKSADGQETAEAHASRVKAYEGSWVADVEIAHPVGAQLRKYDAIKKLDAKLRAARAQVKKFRLGSPEANDAAMKKALLKLTAVQVKMDKQMEKMPSLKKGVSKTDCVAALVIFNNEESYNRCIADYAACAHGSRYFGEKGQPKGLRFPRPCPDPPPTEEGAEGGEAGAAPEQVSVSVDEKKDDPVAAAAALLKGADAKTQEKEAAAVGKKPPKPKKEKKPKREKAPPTEEELLWAPCAISDGTVHADGLDYWPIQVDALSEPSNVLWENLETSDEERAWRKRLTNFVTFLCLLFSFTFIYSAQSAKKAFDAKKPKPEHCGSSNMASDIAAVHLGTYDFELPMQRIEWNAAVDAQVGCEPDEAGRPTHFFHYKAARYDMGGGAVFVGAPLANAPKPGPGNAISSLEPFASPTNATLLVERSAMVAEALRETPPKTLCGGGCTNVFAVEAADQVCAALPCVHNLSGWAQQAVIKKSKARLRCRTNYHRGAIAGCFCQAKLNEALAKGKLPKSVKLAYPLCAEFVDDHLFGIAVAQIAVLVVAIVNILLKSTLKKLAVFERNFTVSLQATSVSTKIFFATFLNTALIVLVVNGSLPNIPSPMPGTGILEGEFSSLSAEWYTVVAVALTGNMMLNIFVPHAGALAKMVLQPLVRRLKKSKVATQRQLNELYEGPPFEIETRFPVVLNSLFVTMMYSAGIPILLPFCAISMFISYHLDKVTLLRMYAQPPMYDESLAVQTQQMLPAALILHLGLAVWMYGDPETLKSPVMGLSSFVGRPVDQGNAAEVDAAFEEFLELVAPYDPMGDRGFFAKIVRVNVVPIILTLAAVVAAVVLEKMGLLRIVLEVARQSVGRVLRTAFKVLAKLARRTAEEVKRRRGGGAAKVAPQEEEGGGALVEAKAADGGGDSSGTDAEEAKGKAEEEVLPPYTGPFYKPLNPPSLMGSTDSIFGLLAARYAILCRQFGPADQTALVVVLFCAGIWVGNTFGGARGYVMLWVEVLGLGIGGAFYLMNVVADAPPDAAGGDRGAAARRGSTLNTELGHDEQAHNKDVKNRYTWVLEGNRVLMEWRSGGEDRACERKHEKGDKLLVWEAMAEKSASSCSYRMQHNRKYMDALLALSAMDFSKAETLEKERATKKEEKRVEKEKKKAANAARKKEEKKAKAEAKAKKTEEKAVAAKAAKGDGDGAAESATPEGAETAPAGDTAEAAPAAR